MPNFILSPAAQADVSDIWHYTERRWGRDQAKKYMQGIRDACHDLAAGTRTSRPADIRQGYRKVLVGSHIIFFKMTDANDVVIIRILYQRMDTDKHL